MRPTRQQRHKRERGRVLAAWALGPLAVSALLAACGSGAPKAASTTSTTLDPHKPTPALIWAEDVCIAASTWSNATYDEGVQFYTTAQANPNATLSQSRNQLVGFLTETVSSTKTLVKQVQDTGKPKVPAGPTIAATFQGNLGDLLNSYESALAEAKTLPVNAPQAFNAAAGNLTQTLISVNTQLRDSMAATQTQDTSGTLKKAFSLAPACHNLYGNPPAPSTTTTTPHRAPARKG